MMVEGKKAIALLLLWFGALRAENPQSTSRPECKYVFCRLKVVLAKVGGPKYLEMTVLGDKKDVAGDVGGLSNGERTSEDKAGGVSDEIKKCRTTLRLGSGLTVFESTSSISNSAVGGELSSLPLRGRLLCCIRFCSSAPIERSMSV
eukprot:GDKK01048333.1.p2 GENE.GDKK01048333.1~~GDKK01048333.1.p2  ORF type:complete len:147 (+),score=2.88 GDKK01048333.1:188-628(+)